MKAQPLKHIPKVIKGCNFLARGALGKGLRHQSDFREKKKKITERLKGKTKADNVQELNYLCYKIKRQWSVASVGNRHFTIKFSSI